MKKILLILLAFSCQVYSQDRTFKIADKTTDSPISYATVNLLNDYGAFADDKGSFTITDSSINKIVVSSIGYRSDTIVLDNIIEKIFLEPKPIELEEIVLHSKKLKRKEKKIKEKVHQDGMNMYASAIGLQVAFFVENNKEEVYLSTITLPLITKNFVPAPDEDPFVKVDFKSLIKIEILKNADGMPGEKYSDFEQIALIKSNGDKRAEIQLESEIPVPQDGMFVKFTVLGNTDENGNLLQEPSYKLKEVNGKQYKFIKYIQPNFPLQEGQRGLPTFVMNSFNISAGWGKIPHPFVYTKDKEYPELNIGFGYTLAMYK